MINLVKKYKLDILSTCKNSWFLLGRMETMEFKMLHLIVAALCLGMCGLLGAAEPQLTGKVIYPNSPDYNKERLISNYYPSKNKYPKAIVLCQNAQDVQNAVKWARANNVPIRIRSGGHNHEGYSTGTDVLIIDVSEMKELQVDKTKNIATVQPGVTGGELYKRLYKDGLTQVGGTCGDVGISGLILTGGMGPQNRLHGMSCDTLLSLDIVNAEGELLHVTPDNEYKDLFWASCGGGGGNFGVVTSLALKVYPIGKVTWFNIGWDWTQPVEQVINTWQEFFKNEDKRFFSHLDVWAKSFPVNEYQKQPVKVLGVFYGSPEDARKELAPFLSIGGRPKMEEFEFVEWDKAINAFEEATTVFVTAKPEYKSTGAYAKNALHPEAVKIIVDTLSKTSSPMMNVLLFSLGGAINDKTPTETAYWWRDPKFFVVYTIQWLKEDQDKVQTAEIDALRTKLLPYAYGDYLGNPDRNLKDYLKDYYGDNVERLRQIKKKYDPKNVFSHEQSIPPAN